MIIITMILLKKKINNNEHNNFVIVNNNYNNCNNYIDANDKIKLVEIDNFEKFLGTEINNFFSN